MVRLHMGAVAGKGRVVTGMLDINLFVGWLATGERGLSSEAIVTRLTSVPLIPTPRHPWTGGSHPHDRDDFRRCELLLREVPLARFAFHDMRSVSAEWAALVDAWDELVALAESEVPGMFTRPCPGGSAPLTYARMRRILDGCAGGVVIGGRS